MIGLEVDGKPLMRACSIASPTWSDEIEFLSIKVGRSTLTRLQLVRRAIRCISARSRPALVADALLPASASSTLRHRCRPRAVPEHGARSRHL